MYNNTQKEAVMLQDYYESILTYVDAYQPSVKEVLEFIGALIHSVVDMIDLTQEEKDFYVEIYNRLLAKEINLKQPKEKEGLLQTV